MTCPCSRYTLQWRGNWKGASGTVHPDTFWMIPLNSGEMCGRHSILIHGGDCAADPSRVRSAQFSSVYLQAFAACALSDNFFRAASSFPMKYAPASKVALSWKLYSSSTVLTCIFAACLRGPTFASRPILRYNRIILFLLLYFLPLLLSHVSHSECQCVLPSLR